MLLNCLSDITLDVTLKLLMSFDEIWQIQHQCHANNSISVTFDINIFCNNYLHFGCLGFLYAQEDIYIYGGTHQNFMKCLWNRLDDFTFGVHLV